MSVCVHATLRDNIMWTFKLSSIVSDSIFLSVYKAHRFGKEQINYEILKWFYKNIWLWYIIKFNNHLI